MSDLKRNVVANFAGRVWANVVNVAAVPIYLKLVGIEAYGLVGFYVALQTMFAYLDFGLGPATVREIARLGVDDSSAARQRDLIRTLEYIYWLLAILFGTIVYAAAPVIAERWVQPEQLSTATVTNAVRWMGLAIAVQFPFAMYSGALMGLQRQVLVNTMMVASSTARAIGAVLGLMFIAPRIEVFLAVHALVGLATTLWSVERIWQVLPHAEKKAAFHLEVIRDIWKFAVGTTGLALAHVAFLQADKLILSTMLPLAAFGYYTVAQSVTGVLWSAITPVSVSFFPRMAQLTAPENREEVLHLFHRACQSIAVLVFPPALVLVFFSYEVLAVWTHNAAVATNASVVVSLAALAMMAVAVGEMPNLLRLAFGWIELALKARIGLLLVFVPLLIFCASRWGAVGAAAAWLVVNVAYLVITVLGTHRRLLYGELRRWFVTDTMLPLAATTAAAVMARFALSTNASTPTRVIAVGLAGLVMLIVAVAASGLRGRVWREATELRLRFANGKG
ncbi:MAG TPA: oligosaccharide flippase family protein [Thermoanaerobaculia bacterium]|nr:oligosaccharide flippase family protein [Thermoanaerobaculia bacterium]